MTRQRQKARERDKTIDAQETREIPGRISKKMNIERETKQKGEGHKRLSTEHGNERI